MNKPRCKLIGENGNIFNLMGIASRTLEEAGMKEKAKEMCGKIEACHSYGEALCIIGDYVDITGSDDEENEFELEEG